ncbi:hypothetical protein [Natronomonas gomsonensis]|uniref:hypothetical protein n=1 Tax=Natronomonas gomsonensis TaxID=1046043 RepID=UPI0015BC06CB|nr:hypothetical protein [Natronomonas gomsonensis]
MAPNGTDDESDERKTYDEYKRAKNPRANEPGEAGPRDPSAEMAEDHGIGTGFEDLSETEATKKSYEEEVIDEGWSAFGTKGVEKERATPDSEKTGLSLTEADIRQAQQTPDERREELLRGIRNELHALNRKQEFDGASPPDRHLTEKGLTSLYDDLQSIVESESESNAEELETALNAYCDDPTTGGLEDSIGEVLQYVQTGATESEA